MWDRTFEYFITKLIGRKKLVDVFFIPPRFQLSVSKSLVFYEQFNNAYLLQTK